MYNLSMDISEGIPRGISNRCCFLSQKSYEKYDIDERTGNGSTRYSRIGERRICKRIDYGVAPARWKE